MKVFQKIKAFFSRTTPQAGALEINERLARLERGYIVLLKRVLEMDGVKLSPLKIDQFSSKTLQTTADTLNNGLNEPKPTIH